MKLLRYDSIRNICLVCQRIGNVYRLIEVSANDLTIGQLRGEG